MERCVTPCSEVVADLVSANVAVDSGSAMSACCTVGCVCCSGQGVAIGCLMNSQLPLLRL